MKKFIFVFSFIGLCLSAANLLAEDAGYVGTKKCKMCHIKLHKSWQAMKHANAYGVLQGDEQKDAECLACHTTGFNKGGYDLAKSAEENEKYKNVGCESCHGAGQAHIKAKKVDKKAAIITKVTACSDCHNPHRNMKKEIEEKRNAAK